MTASTPATLDVDPYTRVPYNHGVLVTHYALDLNYAVEPNSLSGEALISITVVGSEPRPYLTLDLAANLAVRRVTLKQGPKSIKLSKFRSSGGKLRLNFSAPLVPGNELVVQIRYGGNPRPISSPWGALGWEETHSGAIVASQPNGAPSWFPCNDTPSNKATFDIAITTNNPFVVVATGELVSRRSAGPSHTRWHYRSREPLATYLATVAVGEFQQLRLSEQVTVYAPARLRRLVEDEFSQQQEMIDFFSTTFGPYPFADYRVIVTEDVLEIPLEAQGASIFGSNHVRGDHAFNRLIAHELAHQWFGNSLGLNRWSDIWLNEGFACYSEWLWAEYDGGPAAHHAARSHYGVLGRKKQDLILADPGTRDMFDDRVYKRGALTLHALRRLLGDAAFFGAVRSYVAARAHSTVTPADFIGYLRAAAGSQARGIDTLLQHWLYEAPLPKFPA